MKKKLFAMLLTAALVAAQGVTALAAPSAGAGEVIKDASGNAVLTVETPDATVAPIEASAAAEVADTYLASTVSAATKEAVTAQLTEAAGGKVDTILKSMTAEARSGIRRFTFIPSLGVLDVTPAAGSTEVKLTVPNIPAGAKVYALHLTKDGTWEQISVTRDGDLITLSSSNWSPVILGYKEPWVDPDPGHGSSGGGQSSSAETTSAGLVASPKTGVASDWSLWMGGAVALLAVASVMFRKKEA